LPRRCLSLANGVVVRMIDPDAEFFSSNYFDWITRHKELTAHLHQILGAGHSAENVNFVRYRGCVMFTDLNFLKFWHTYDQSNQFFPAAIKIEDKDFFVTVATGARPEAGAIYLDYFGRDNPQTDEAWYNICQKYNLKQVDWYQLGAYLV